MAAACPCLGGSGNIGGEAEPGAQVRNLRGTGSGNPGPSVPRRAAALRADPSAPHHPSTGCRVRCDLPRPRSSPAALGQPLLAVTDACSHRYLRSLPPAVGPVCPEPLEAQPDPGRFHSGSPASGWSGGPRSPRRCPDGKIAGIQWL